MKVNTDGVLLGALATANNPKNVLDIGTGTGVIALMLAQRFPDAKIDAVEIDEAAAQTATKNFAGSRFAERMALFAMSFEDFFESHPKKRYDLIVTNPPFFLNSLTSPGMIKSLARHTNEAFFERLISELARHLTPDGICAMVLPLATASLVKVLLPKWDLGIQSSIQVKSFARSLPHREIFTIGSQNIRLSDQELVIYSEPQVYTPVYQYTLKDFLTIF